MPGIPIRAVINKLDERDPAGQRHKFYARIKNESAVAGDDHPDTNYLKHVEKEFAVEAENVLERLQLSHMRKPHKKHAHPAEE